MESVAGGLSIVIGSPYAGEPGFAGPPGWPTVIGTKAARQHSRDEDNQDLGQNNLCFHGFTPVVVALRQTGHSTWRSYVPKRKWDTINAAPNTKLNL